MTTTYLSATTARNAQQIQNAHSPGEGGWCSFCLRHRTRVRAGECEPFQRAQAFLDAYRQQENRRPAPSRPAASRVWPVET